MDGTRKFKKAGIPYEEIKIIKFQNTHTGKYYRIHLVEPVSQEDLEKYGSTILEAEVTKLPDDTELIGGFTEYKLDKAPPAVQGFICDYRRRIISEMHHKDHLDDVLKVLEEAGIAEPLSGLPEGVEGVRFKPKPEWKLFGIGSEIEFPWGEMLKDSDGWDFELVGGTPPHKPASAGFIRVVDLHGDKHEYYPHVFKLEWRKVHS